MHPHIHMLLWSILIASSFPAVSLVANKIDASSLTALRFLCASVLFLPFIIKNKEMTLPTRIELFHYLILAFCIVYYFWAMFKALETSTPLNTGAIFTLIPVLTAGISYFLSKIKVSKRVMVALLVGAIGSLWVVVRGSIDTLLQLSFLEGDVLFFSGCVVLAFYGPLIVMFREKHHKNRSAAYISFWVMAIGTILLLCIALIELDGALHWSQLSHFDFFVILYLAIFSTIVTFWQLQHCTPILGSTVVNAYIYLTPSLVLVIDLLIFNREIAEIVYFGIALTLISLFILVFKTKVHSIES